MATAADVAAATDVAMLVDAVMLDILPTRLNFVPTPDVVFAGSRPNVPSDLTINIPWLKILPKSAMVND